MDTVFAEAGGERLEARNEKETAPAKLVCMKNVLLLLFRAKREILYSFLLPIKPVIPNKVRDLVFLPLLPKKPVIPNKVRDLVFARQREILYSLPPPPQKARHSRVYPEFIEGK